MYQREPLYRIAYLGCHNICFNFICWDWTCDWMSQLVMFNHMLLCLLTQLFPPYWLNQIRSGLTTQSQLVFSGDFSELSIIPNSLFLLINEILMFFPSPPLGIWWNTLPTILQIIWLVSPRPHVKYMKTIYSDISGGFIYSNP